MPDNPPFNQRLFAQTLRAIAIILNEHHITWCLGASGGLYLQNVAVTPHDIDIIVDITDFDKAYKLLGPLLPGKQQTHRFDTVTFNKYPLDATTYPAEVAGFDIKSDAFIIMNWEDSTIPVHPLEVELKLYRQRPGKKTTVSLIEQALQRDTPSTGSRLARQSNYKSD